GTANYPFIRSNEYITLESNKQYYLVLEYRTSEVPEIDYIMLLNSNNNEFLITDFVENDDHLNLDMSGQWTKLVIPFTLPTKQTGRLNIGTHFGINNTKKGVIDLRLPYLTNTNNTEWVPHRLDEKQIIEDVSRRVTELEDGRKELITRSEYDFDTGNLDQHIKSV